MNFDATVHAEPGPGETRSPCCGLTIHELPRADWLSRTEAEVTCGKLSDRDIELLLGVPQVAEPRTDQPATAQFVFELANRIRQSHAAGNYRTAPTPTWR